VFSLVSIYVFAIYMFSSTLMRESTYEKDYRVFSLVSIDVLNKVFSLVSID
jgi:hypothetical protein